MLCFLEFVSKKDALFKRMLRKQVEKIVRMQNFFFLLLSCILLIFAGCTGIPAGVKPVSNLNLASYQGTWYEIARIENWFERDTQQVSATYTLRDDGFVDVVNRGFDPQKQKWREAKGLAKPVEGSAPGHLKVSFWGPFYGSYIVFECGANYEYAFVCGYKKTYLWLLARKKSVSKSVMERFLDVSKKKGFDLNNLVITKHTP